MPPFNLSEAFALCTGILTYVIVPLIPVAVIVATFYVAYRYLHRKDPP